MEGPFWRVTPPEEMAFLTPEEKLAQLEAELVHLEEVRHSCLAQIEEVRRARLSQLSLMAQLEGAMAEEIPNWRELTKGTQGERGDSGGLAAEEGPLAQDVISLDSGDKDPRHHQVSSLEIFRLRRCNLSIQATVPLLAPGPNVLVKTEEGKSLLEREPFIEKPVVVPESLPQSVASLEIPLVAAQFPEIQVGPSR